MIFTDWKFFVFFAVAFVVYWNIKSNARRKVWLLACSVFFYGAWDWRFLSLVFFVIGNTYATTLLIARTESAQLRHRILVVGIAISLGVLGVFKYYNFFIDSLARWIQAPDRIQDLILPIGISFYTFHSLSYMIDTYRRRIVPTRNLGDVALYILFFPQLVAGPIVRATDLLPQMLEKKRFADVRFKYFLAMFLVGYFKKTVISDNVSMFVDAFYRAPGAYGAGDAVFATVFYSVQIYCDFSGYTDMAIATAGLLGYQLKPNFNHPYLASNLIEFWRRWHISLSLFLRDYLYIPLGGNREGPLHQARNIFVTMLLGGLWHGASWTFVVWGALHGVGLIVNRVLEHLRGVDHSSSRYSLVGNALTFGFVTLAWIFFRSPDFAVASQIIERFAVFQPVTLVDWQKASAVLVGMLALHVAFYRLDLERMTTKVRPMPYAFGYGAAVALILPFVNVNVQPFIYFQF
ncbi:MAG: MBOAT family protein [Alphaproteobacteria bacterium]|nr:MBOAT family protein [Alphaproteobacteria bacterium]